MKKIGARFLVGRRCEFVVWAPLLEQLKLSVISPVSQEVDMQRDERGYFHATLDDVASGSKYFYKINGENKADPVSFYQPEDVLGPSYVVDHNAFNWQDRNWKGIPLKSYILYELHIGTFTSEGTFESAEKKLDELVNLGITAVEIMPVAQFSGTRNWGYDGVYPYAVQHSYGGPEGFKEFVNACHQRGLAVVLDVVYNHLGPEGNVLPQFMPVFTDKYRTPWGAAINYDDAYSDGVRQYFIQNAIYWMEHYHIDALRLDAIHGIYDMSARHFLKEMAEEVDRFSQQRQQKFYLIAESDLNDRRLILSTQREGYGIDSQWNDDFHHAVHAMVTHEKAGYYEDFGSIEQVARAMKDGFVYAGDFSTFRKRRHGSSSKDILSEKFVVCIQNHDQVGNRFNGDRLSTLVSFDALKVAAGAMIFSSYIPLLFMGEEYAEKAPFTYFMDFHDQKLIEAVRQGRKQEFSAFGWKEEPRDPYAESTFAQAKLNWDLRSKNGHKVMLAFYKKLIELRKTIPPLSNFNRDGMEIKIQESLLIVKRHWDGSSAYIVMNLGGAPVKINNDFLIGNKILDSAEGQWNGAGSLLPVRIITGEVLTVNPWSLALYHSI